MTMLSTLERDKKNVTDSEGVVYAVTRHKNMTDREDVVYVENKISKDNAQKRKLKVKG